MSIAHLLPIRLGLLDRHGKHRAIDQVDRLRHQLDGANLLLAGYRIQLDDAGRNLADEQERRQVAEKELQQAENVIRLRDRQIADLQRKVDVGVKAEHVIAETQPIPVVTRVVPLHRAPFAATDPGRLPDPAA